MPIQTLSLPAGKVLTVTAGAEKAATLYQIAATGLPGTPTAISAAGTSSVGPFGAPYSYGIDDENGSATYAISTPNPANTTVDQSLAEGVDISTGTSTGSKVATATDQKLAFHNSTPVVQRASANQTAVTDNTGGSVADAIAAAVTTFTPSVAWDGAAVFPSAADATAIAAAITALTNGLAKNLELTNELRAALVEKGLIKGSA